MTRTGTAIRSCARLSLWLLRDFWANAENRGGIYGLVTFASAVVVISRGIYVGNMLVGFATAFCGVAWVMIFIFSLGGPTTTNGKGIYKRFIRTFEILTVGSLSTMFITLPGSPWVVPSTGQTSLSRSFFYTPPFATPLHYSFEWDKSVSTTIDVPVLRAAGGTNIPARCSVYAKNIVEDYRNRQALEAHLLALAQTGDPVVQMRSDMVTALADTTKAALAGRTFLEIAEQQQWEVPYYIGTVLGTALARNHLRWQEGFVVVSCKLAPFNT